MTLVVMGRASSINVRKVLWTAAELGLSIEHQPWGEGDLRLDSPAFLALNPNRLVPVLKDGDTVLLESNTICRYLAATAQATAWLPAEPLARARVAQWMDWQATELNPAWRHAFMHRVRRHPDFADEAAAARSAAAWGRCLQILEDHLASNGPYVTGETPTLADLVLALSTHRWLATPMSEAERPALPQVRAHHHRLSQRPAWVAAGCGLHP